MTVHHSVKEPIPSETRQIAGFKESDSSCP
jgi:hypothetical protein